MLKKEFVTYEIALKLKELNFDEECIALYEDKYLCNDVCFDITNDDTYVSNSKLYEPKNEIAAPLWQQAIDWLREKHSLEITTYDSSLKPKYTFSIRHIFKCMPIYYTGTKRGNPEQADKYFDNYEKAREQAILKAIDLCKEKSLYQH